MIKILPNVKLSSNYVKGNIASRNKVAENLNDNVFQGLIALYDKKNTCYISKIKDCYNANLPEQKKVDIIALPQKIDMQDDGYIVPYITDSGVEKFAIGIVTRKKHNKQRMLVRDIPSLMHESAHIFDYLMHPKYMVNYCKMCEKGIFDKKYFEIYDELFYNVEHVGDYGLKHKEEILKNADNGMREALTDVPADEKLVFLKHMKYSMETEYNAYNQDYKFNQLILKLRHFKKVKSYRNWNEYYHFPDKIKIVNKLIKETLESERAK